MFLRDSHIHSYETKSVYILRNIIRQEIYSAKGGFPLGKITDDFAAKSIWTCALTFACSLSGEILLLEIVKMNLTNSRRKKSPQLLDQSKHTFLVLPGNIFPSDQIQDGCK